MNKTLKPQDDTAAAAQAAFSATFEREYAQRADAPGVDAALHAAARACRETLVDRWIATQAADAIRPPADRRIHYLSMEFLMGRALRNAWSALGINDVLSAKLQALGHEAGALVEREPDAGLGNGGLGRLAACFLDSLATLGLPSFGYGLRYEFGMFTQSIADGRQVEQPDQWLRRGNAWELPRTELRYPVGFGGRVERDGAARRWVPARRIMAQAWDFIVPGHGGERVSTLRQWQAQAEGSIDFPQFCRGEHEAAGRERLRADTLNWVLYPDDSTEAGRMMRLEQEYLLVSASIQDMLARHLREARELRHFGRDNVVHLNDTHPALAVPELMRLLLDEHGLTWDEAWSITRQAVSYTNHTLMPEALETWALPLFQHLLPRHLEIVFDINDRFLIEVRALHPNDEGLVQRISLIDEHGERRVRMAPLAIVGSNHVNGVSKLHSQLMVSTIFADFARLDPERFTNVTNGVTHRRWLAQANPALSAVIDETIGPRWRREATALAALHLRADEQEIGAAFMRAKHANKQRLADRIRRDLGIAVDANSLFDVHIKRIHEYKRQLLNLLHVVARYQAMLADPRATWVPRTVIFAGKAASAYRTAKQIIHLIHDVARVINSDERLQGRLRMVFMPNYSVSLAEVILPAADLSEQISTAGTEASGTGNMKFALNAALTIGTWDGANIEMAQAMGEEQMFVFGLRAEQVARIKELGYDPSLYVEENRALAAVLDAIARGDFSPAEPERHRGLIDGLRHHDPYLLMADFKDYVATQLRVDALYASPVAWAARAVRNVASMGGFSSDRSIRDYQRHIWVPR